MAALGAILLMVAYHMSEWRVFQSELRGAPGSDVLVMLTTFALTVMVDLTVAIEVGMVLAALLFMKRMAEVTNINALTKDFQDDGNDEKSVGDRRLDIPSGVEIYAIDGPFFFGAAEKFKSTLGQISKKPKVLVILMDRVPTIDSTGMHAFARAGAPRPARRDTRHPCRGARAAHGRFRPLSAPGRGR